MKRLIGWARKNIDWPFVAWMMVVAVVAYSIGFRDGWHGATSAGAQNTGAASTYVGSPTWPISPGNYTTAYPATTNGTTGGLLVGDSYNCWSHIPPTKPSEPMPEKERKAKK